MSRHDYLWIEARSNEVETMITLGDTEYGVFGSYYPGDPGRTDGPPELCYPEGDDEVIVDEIVDEDGNRLAGEAFAAAYEDACDAIRDAYWGQ